jgi:hypothetical protein
VWLTHLLCLFREFTDNMCVTGLHGSHVFCCLLASDVVLLLNEGSYVEFLRLRKLPLVEAQPIARSTSGAGGFEHRSLQSETQGNTWCRPG